jgi:hypothetical protein
MTRRPTKTADLPILPTAEALESLLANAPESQRPALQAQLRDRKTLDIYTKGKWAGKEADKLKEEVILILQTYGRQENELGILKLGERTSYPTPNVAETEARLNALRDRLVQMESLSAPLAEKELAELKQIKTAIPELETFLGDPEDCDTPNPVFGLRRWAALSADLADWEKYWQATGLIAKRVVPTADYTSQPKTKAPMNTHMSAEKITDKPRPSHVGPRAVPRGIRTVPALEILGSNAAPLRNVELRASETHPGHCEFVRPVPEGMVAILHAHVVWKRQPDGSFLPVLKLVSQQIKICEESGGAPLGSPGVPYSTLLRLWKNGFIKGSSIGPRSICIDLASWLRHVEETRDPFYWTAERRAQFSSVLK